MGSKFSHEQAIKIYNFLFHSSRQLLTSLIEIQRDDAQVNERNIIRISAHVDGKFIDF